MRRQLCFFYKEILGIKMVVSQNMLDEIKHVISALFWLECGQY